MSTVLGLLFSLKGLCGAAGYALGAFSWPKLVSLLSKDKAVVAAVENEVKKL